MAACVSARSRCRSTCAWRGPSARRAAPAARSSSTRRWTARRTAAPRCSPTHDLDAPAIVVHTSGTTAAPRPVELTYGNWLWSALGSAVALGLDPGERWLCTLPLSHVGGLSILLRSTIYATTAVLHDGFDAAAAARELGAGRATLVSVVPTTLARLLDAGLERPPALRAALVGGGPIVPALLERAAAAGVPVVTTYGLTEACSQVTTGGPPLFCTRVRIARRWRDPRRRSHGRAGGRRGGRLAAHRRPRRARRGGQSQHPRTRGGHDRHGRRERRPGRGRGRPGDPSGGRRRGRARGPDEAWGERVVATIVLRPHVTATAQELKGYCRVRLAHYKVPKLFRFSLDLPRTQSGKLLRRDLED